MDYWTWRNFGQKIKDATSIEDMKTILAELVDHLHSVTPEDED